MSIVKNQGQEPPGGGYTFVGVLRDLEQNLPQHHKTPEVKAILAEGLKIAQKTDDEYKKNRNFTIIRLYQLHKVAFKLWSYQHELLLDHLTLPSKRLPEQLPEYENIIRNHKELGIKIFTNFGDTVYSEDSEILKKILLEWAANVAALRDQFTSLPKGSHPKGKKPISSDTIYILISTLSLISALLIATLILSR